MEQAEHVMSLSLSGNISPDLISAVSIPALDRTHEEIPVNPVPHSAIFSLASIYGSCCEIESDCDLNYKVFRAVCSCLVNLNKHPPILNPSQGHIPATTTLADEQETSSICKYQTNHYDESFEELEVVASGGFGTVYKVRHKVDKAIYAVKKVPFSYENEQRFQMIIREAEQLAALKHPNIIYYNYAWLNKAEDDLGGSEEDYESESQLFDPSSSEQSSANASNSRASLSHATLYIQMEFCDYDLASWLLQRNNNEDSAIVRVLKPIDIFYQVLIGVSYIHSKSIIHRDLKPSNIFISKEKGTVKIGDFGLSRVVPLEGRPKAHSSTTNGSLSMGIGTPPYAAPEQLENHNYDFNVDTYSCGIILFELLEPCTTKMEFYRFVENIKKGEYPPQMHSDYVPLIRKMIQIDPQMRPAVSEILDSPLFMKKRVSKHIQDLKSRIVNLQYSYRYLQDVFGVLKNELIDVYEICQSLQLKNKRKTQKIRDLHRRLYGTRNR